LATVDNSAVVAGRVSTTVGGEKPNQPDGGLPGLPPDVARQEPDKLVPFLVDYAAKLRVSDLFFNANEDGVEVAARHLGLLRHLAVLPAELGRRCVLFIKTMADMNISERRRPMDGRWLFNRQTGHRLDLRINTIPTLYGEDLTLRILDSEHRLLGIDQLGLDRTLYNNLLRVLNSPSGLMLVTGPTETGKSTTLYACLNHLNNGERKINTIEDPIEYSIRNLRQSQVNSKIGLGFDELLRSVLRQAPNVIMIGEIRDPETAMTAVLAANSGHLVLSTLHAPVSTGAVESLLRLGVHPHLLSNSLLGVIAQRLLRTLCPKCKVQFRVPGPNLFSEVSRWLEPGQGDYLCGPRGCPECHMTGYSGRTGVFEMLRISPVLRGMIDERAPSSAIRKKAVEEGMLVFRHSALLKVAQGETSIEEVVRVLPAEYLE
jgi:type II secretory ATPase GspE/PulE/Tfp pilus assembly ATPase PilB-like protein